MNEVFYKPYENPAIVANPEAGMTDEAYHRGVQITTTDLTFPAENGEKKLVTLVHTSGLSDRGGKDVVFITNRVDGDVVIAFMNSLIMQVGIGGFAIADFEEARLITVPIPKYKQAFLPPLIAIAVVSAEWYEFLSNDKIIAACGFDEPPTHTIAFYDKDGRNYQDEEFHSESVTQFRLSDANLDILVEYEAEGLGDPFSTDVRPPSQQLDSHSFAATVASLIDDNGVPLAGAMDLNAMSHGMVGEAEIEAARKEDQEWDDEVANLSKPNPEDGIHEQH